MKQNGLPTSFCFAWRSTDSDRLNVSLFMLSPWGRMQNYKFLMKGARRKPKGEAGFFLWLRHNCRFHSYEATKIELLAGQHGNAVTFPRNSNNSITAANLLKDVEKPYGADHFFERYLAPSGRAFKIQKKSARFFCQITWRLRALPMKGAYIPG